MLRNTITRAQPINEWKASRAGICINFVRNTRETAGRFLKPRKTVYMTLRPAVNGDSLKETLINHRFQPETDRGRVVEQENR